MWLNRRWRRYGTWAVPVMAMLSSWPRVWAQPGGAAEILRRAEQELRDGQLDEADATAAGLLAVAPTSAGAHRIRGAVALWRNDVPTAVAALTRVLEQTPRDRATAALLAEAFYRADRFADAARWFAMSGRPAHAQKLASFGNVVPYRIDGNGGAVRFLQTDPLPLLEVTLNGGSRAVFLLDTGGGEVMVDSALAARLGLPRYGRDRGTFGGGSQASVEHSRLASLQVGRTVIHDLPALIMPTRALLTSADGRGLDGILGTTLLSRVLATLDYAKGELHLVTPDHQPEDSGQPRTADVEIPFWLVDDHYMLARGTFNHLPPQLFFIDTGLGGAAFAAPDRLLRSAGVRLGDAGVGVSGGGTIGVRPFPIDRVSLGALERVGMQGLAGVFPASLENGLGIRVGGLIGHDFFRGLRTTLDFERMRVGVDLP